MMGPHLGAGYRHPEGMVQWVPVMTSQEMDPNMGRQSIGGQIMREQQMMMGGQQMMMGGQQMMMGGQQMAPPQLGGHVVPRGGMMMRVPMGMAPFMGMHTGGPSIITQAYPIETESKTDKPSNKAKLRGGKKTAKHINFKSQVSVLNSRMHAYK